MGTVVLQLPPMPSIESTASVGAFDASLRGALDSAFFMHAAPTPADTLPVSHLMAATEVVPPVPAPPEVSPFFWGLLLLYFLVVAANRFRIYPISGTSLRSFSDRVLPHLFQTERTCTDAWAQRMRFVSVCLGMAVCAAVLLHRTESVLQTASVLAGCIIYITVKHFFRLVSAFMLDVEPLSAAYVRKKQAVIYNLMLCLVPLSCLYLLYPYLIFAVLFALLCAVAAVLLLVASVTIFSSGLRLYGIFLYFCTLEILPAVCVIVYVLRY